MRHSSSETPPQAPSDSIARETRLTLIGILLGLFLAALDQTIVSTALPKIIADLNGAEFYAWVIPDSVSSAPNGDELTRPKGVL